MIRARLVSADGAERWSRQLWPKCLARVVALALLAAPQKARADLELSAPLRPANAVKLRLWTLEPRLSLELFRPNQRPGKVPPFDACVTSCTLWEPPGRYRLFVKGWPGSGVRPSYRDFTLSGPSAVTVQPPSSLAHDAGLAMGITGSLLFSVGLFFTLVQTSIGGSSAFVKTSDKLVAATLLGGGAALGVSGFILFGSNRKPELQITALPH